VVAIDLGVELGASKRQFFSYEGDSTFTGLLA